MTRSRHPLAARRTAAVGTALAVAAPLALLAGGTAAAAPPAPRTQVDRIELPDGWQPEGVTTDGRRLWSGSLATGELLRADPHTGRTLVLPRSESGTPAVGIDYDAARRVIWVAGGESGTVKAHDARSGRLLATYTLPAPDSGARFVNDLVVTDDAVYATDSQNQELVVVALDGEGRRGLPASGEAETVPLTGDIVYGPGFNANGIVAKNGYLLVVQSNTGKLFRVDPATGEAQAVDLGGATLTNGDGLELDGDVLYAVRNRLNQVAVLELADDLTSAEQVATLTSGDYDVPTTVAVVGDSLWAVNARFGNPAPETAQYWMTRVEAYGS